MSYRIEEKILVSQSDGFILLSELNNKGFKKQYPDRKISSIYFDNNNYKIFEDSEEGLLPRKKIRIRHYPQSQINNYSLEIKISSIEGRYKKSKVILNGEKNHYIKNSYYDNLYGPVSPICIVEYIREYYIKGSIRITFDKNIRYINYKNKVFFDEENSVIEIKADPNHDRDYINRLIPHPRKRFSKFSESVRNLNLC